MDEVTSSLPAFHSPSSARSSTDSVPAFPARSSYGPAAGSASCMAPRQPPSGRCVRGGPALPKMLCLVAALSVCVSATGGSPPLVNSGVSPLVNSPNLWAGAIASDPGVNEKFGYRKKSVEPPRKSRLSERERLRLQLQEQESRQDGFHFDQSFNQEKEKFINRLGVVLSNSECKLTPSPVVAPEANHFVIECPASVKKVTANFLSGSPFKEAVSANGWVRQKKLTFTLDPSGTVTSQHIQACVNSKQKNTCYPVQFDAKCITGKLPLASRVIAAVPATPQPTFNSNMRLMHLTAFENEPLEVIMEGVSHNFVDVQPLRPERGFINETGRLIFRPRGDVDERMMYITDREHNLINNLTLEVGTVPSANPLLYDLRSSTGRLDPEFKSSRYSYFLRVFESTTAAKLRFTAIDDKNTHCSWHNDDGSLGSATGQGVTKSLSLGPKLDPFTLVLECFNQNNPEFHVRYLVQVVRQRGGDTLLKSLDVVGGSLQQPFKSATKGPYTVNMKNSGSNDLSWVSFIAKPKNKRAQVAVEGFPCDGDGHSPYFRVPLGDQRLFRIGVRTPENPVAEEYEVIVTRPALGIENTRNAKRLADILGYLSTAASSTRAYHFIHNAKFLQWLSLSSRVTGTPESYNQWATYFNKWNLQWQIPSLVHFVPQTHPKISNWRDSILSAEWPMGNSTEPSRFVAPPTRYGLLQNKFSVEQNGDSAILVSDDAPEAIGAPLLPGAVPLALDFNKAKGEWEPTMVDTDAIRAVLDHIKNLDLAQTRLESENREMENDVENESFFQCAEADDCSTLFELLGINLPTPETQSPRQLLSLDKADRDSLMMHLEHAYSHSQKVLDFATSITTTTLLIAGASFLYLFLWIFHLRKYDDSMTQIRRDCFRWAHPSRFFLFLLDYALISYAQACCGLAFSPLKDVRISILGVETTPQALSVICLVLMVLFPLLFLIVGSMLIASASGQLVFAKAFSRHHDRLVVEGKAFWQPLPWLPIIGRLFDIEISNVIPVSNAAAVDDHTGARLVLADEKRLDAPWTESNALNVHGASQDAAETALLQKANSPSHVKYYSNRDSLRISVPEEEYIAGQYDVKNTKLAYYYPDAWVGLNKQPLRNWYGEVVEAECKVELRHLASMFHCSERFNMIVSREHLDLTHNDALSNLIAKSQRDCLFYWALDRWMIAGLVIAMAFLEDASGTKILTIMGGAAALLCLMLLPSVISTSLSMWYVQMEVDSRLYTKLAKYDADDEKKFAVWPWKDPAARNAYLDARDRRENLKTSAPVYAAYRNVIDAVRGFVDHPFWKTRTAMALGVFVSGPAFSELVKFLICLVVLLGSRGVGLLSNGFTAVCGFWLSALALLCLNWESLVTLYRQLQDFSYELYILFRRALIFAVDSAREPATFVHRIQFYIAQAVGALVHRQTNVSFIYSGFQSETCRDFTCREVSVISSEVGVHMTGRQRLTNANKRRMFDESEALGYPRYGVQKTLFQTGTLGVFRHQLDRSLPVEIPLSHFYYSTADPAARLAATIQIVNHNGVRYTPLRAHEWNDDSYFSLFTDPKLVPPPGKLRKNNLGHGYVVQVDRVCKTLTIKGPGIIPGKQYNLKITEKTPEKDPLYSYDESSTSSSSVSGGRAEAECYCRSPGVLVVPVPHGCTPDLQEEITVHPPGGDAKFEVDPAVNKVYFDNFSAPKRMVLRTRGALLSDEPYRVVWDIRRRGYPIVGGGTAQLHGLMLMDVKEDEKALHIDSDTYMVIRDEAKTMTIDIALKDTNAHEFTLPGLQLQGSSSWMTAQWAKVVGEIDTVWSRATIRDVCTERIPCTIVQCVDPVARKYRVEPDFEEALKRLNARREELLALRAQLNNLDCLNAVWWRVLSPAQFVAFWKSKGLDVLDKTGSFIDPTRDPYHPQIRSSAKIIREGEAHLRVVIEKELGERESALAVLHSEYTGWLRAYFDTHLYAAQAELDAAQYAGRDLMEIKQCVEKVQQLKRPYVATIPHFAFPMIVEEKLLSKAANWEAQFALWEKQISGWLLEEEHAATRGEGESLSCYETTLQQIMQALRYTTHKPEDLLRGRTQTVLHYVTNSRVVRGLDFQWRPDPLGAMFACLRTWYPDANGRADFTREPFWLPCMLKLTGSAVKIMLPHGKTAEAYKSWATYKNVFGWYIPLKCFERVECTLEYGRSVPGQRSNPAITSMIGKLVFRRNMQIRVDDDYVRTIAGDAFDNVVPIQQSEFTDRLHIMLGHTTTSRDSALYPAAERQQLGDTLSVYPLTFRLFYGDWRRWESVVWACGMNRPPKDLDDFQGIVPGRDTPTTSSSSSVSIPSQDHLGQPSLHSDVSSPSSSSSSTSVSSTSSSSSTHTYEMPEREELESSSSATSSSHRPAPPPPPPPVPKGAYKGDFQDWRYHGKGTLTDDRGDVVYQGDWRAGQRNGEGKCRYRDADNVGWFYDGHFQRDEFEGPGILTLDDHNEKDRLRASSAPTDKHRIVAFKGNFRLPEPLRRNMSIYDSDIPNTDLQNIREFFRNKNLIRADSAETSESSVSEHPENRKKTLVIDLRRAISACGDETALAAPMGNLDAQFHKSRAYLDIQMDDLDSAASSEKSLNDAKCAINEYLPHTHKWARKLDPNLGFPSATERMAQGTVIYADGCIYEKDDSRGLFRNMPNGRGYFWCPVCGIKYDGYFSKGKPLGYGIMECGTGDNHTLFWGSFRNGLRHGKGVLTAVDGNVYIEGTWNEDVLGGGHALIDVKAAAAGRYKFKRYVGEMANGVPHGEGELIWEDGASYRGQFVNGVRHGEGTMKDENGQTVLHGMWADDTPTGRVTTYYLRNKKRPQDTKVYCGSLEKGERKGFGELYESIAGGLIYEGLWHNNMPHGRGIMHTRDGIYDGEFHQGLRHGKGRFTFNEKPALSGGKRFYEGDWVNDKPEGKGVYLAQDGVSYTFEFRKGKPTDKSLRAYRNGMCGSPPPIGEKDDFNMEDTPIHSIHPEYWGKDKGIKADALRALGHMGEGLWARHEAHAFVYRSSEFSDLPPRPTKKLMAKLSSIRIFEAADKKENLMYLITVKRAEGLPNMDRIKKQDPYVRVMLHHHYKKTKAHLKGGTEPEWNAQLRFPYSVERNIFFEVYDQDTLTKDDFISAGFWELGKWLKKNEQADHNVRIELSRTDKKTRETIPAGVLYFGIEIVVKSDDESISQDSYEDRRIEELPDHIKDRVLEGPEAPTD
eukprot:Gregarina_sp_Poly_1__251@NODE_105_length_14330_cov_232_248545_g92_i0_p1_GENE_NODE_105_length_14330_cov_232_248545_g92_i0NODE_105_length_14330_cov_232_248545_g92_i0_p1_ORF_typecomplete_len3203_score429_54MORN/PF02493_20/2MORN/PF02493_20/0_0082MORN/PF02493_20/1_1MORN/PF02493_20/2_5e03MORN/PF02493_20/7_4e03MORN/PF02493_20/1_3e02MORN/PF02493_20/0_00018MORN/PF02493_20/1_2e04MORN/PF02493_20/0_0014MORN/PF02493_20/0_00049MORN/PF02493_20/1_5e04MORN/PF02493_20/1_4e03MORN/PF02493_20/0_002MORN/PF02493_20/0_